MNIIAFTAGDRPGPHRVQTFGREEDRKRLSGTALKAFLRTMAEWRVSKATAAKLLEIHPRTLSRIEADSRALSQDQLTRISAILGVYKGLKLLVSPALAADWPTRENDNFLFAGRTPIDAMIEGGIPAMLEVRRYIDGARGGL